MEDEMINNKEVEGGEKTNSSSSSSRRPSNNHHSIGISYRSHIISLLPSLNHLDMKRVTELEREESEMDRRRMKLVEENKRKRKLLQQQKLNDIINQTTSNHKRGGELDDDEFYDDEEDEEEYGGYLSSPSTISSKLQGGKRRGLKGRRNDPSAELAIIKRIKGDSEIIFTPITNHDHDHENQPSDHTSQSNQRNSSPSSLPSSSSNHKNGIGGGGIKRSLVIKGENTSSSLLSHVRLIESVVTLQISNKSILSICDWFSSSIQVRFIIYRSREKIRNG